MAWYIHHWEIDHVLFQAGSPSLQKRISALDRKILADKYVGVSLVRERYGTLLGNVRRTVGILIFPGCQVMRTEPRDQIPPI
jgi:hypothetical protein